MTFAKLNKSFLKISKTCEGSVNMWETHTRRNTKRLQEKEMLEMMETGSTGGKNAWTSQWKHNA